MTTINVEAITIRRPGSAIEHAKFPATITGGAKPGLLLQLNGASITAAGDGLDSAAWKLADGTNGKLYHCIPEVLNNTYTEVPLDQHIWQNNFRTPQLLDEVVSGLEAVGLVEYEGSDYLKTDAGDGQVTGAKAVNTELVCVAGRLLVKELTLATLATAAYIRGYTDPKISGNTFRVIVEFVGGIVDHDA